jgi:hypothetical protein
MNKACSLHGMHKKGVCILVWKLEENTQLRENKRRWEDNTKKNFKEMMCQTMDWIQLVAVVGPCENWNELSDSIKAREFLYQQNDYYYI